MPPRKPLSNDTASALYALLKRVALKEFKSCNWYKAKKLLNEYECGFVDESIMVSGARRILSQGKQLPPELKELDE